MRIALVNGYRFFSDKSTKRILLRGKPVYRNDEIVFDHVRVVDRSGAIIGDMSTGDGIELAKSQGLNLNLIRYDVGPPTCVISDDHFISDLSHRITYSGDNRDQDFSFDPTARPATIQISVNIADEEYERKLDLLRKHLLDRRRCRLVIYESEKAGYQEKRFRDLAERVLGDVRDVAKLADSPDDIHDLLSARPLVLNVWPCDTEQTDASKGSFLTDESASVGLLETDERLEKRGRSVRPRVDPRLSLARRDIISDD